MGIHHQDAPALRVAGDFDAEAASEEKMQYISQLEPYLLEDSGTTIFVVVSELQRRLHMLCPTRQYLTLVGSSQTWLL